MQETSIQYLSKDFNAVLLQLDFIIKFTNYYVSLNHVTVLLNILTR